MRGVKARGSFPDYDQTATPSSPSSGEFWWDQNVAVLKRYDGTNWQWVGLDDLANVDTSGKSNGDGLLWDTDVDPDAWVDGSVDGGGGGGSSWSLIVDEDGTSLSNWTSVAGTWAVNGGSYIEQTSTSGYTGLRYDPDVFPAAGIAMQAEMRFPSSGRGLISPTGIGGLSGTHDPWVGIHNGDYAIQRGDQTLNTSPAALGNNVWHTVRAELLGPMATLSVAGSRVFAMWLESAARSTAAYNVMLVCFDSAVDFRNIKVWTLDGPA